MTDGVRLGLQVLWFGGDLVGHGRGMRTFVSHPMEDESTRSQLALYSLHTAHLWDFTVIGKEEYRCVDWPGPKCHNKPSFEDFLGLGIYTTSNLARVSREQSMFYIF
jgi:hypothetical protein